MSHILLLFSAWATAHMGIKLAEAQVPSASLDLSHSVKKNNAGLCLNLQSRFSEQTCHQQCPKLILWMVRRTGRLG